jgi:predicted nuclease of predicted toxin-antitoxin system
LKLLLDQNLSHRLVRAIEDLYPDTLHVRDVGLKAADDQAVWEYAAKQGFVIASKDSDFHQRSFLFGAPPKVVWIRLGNCTTKEIEALLRERHTDLLSFESDPQSAFLVLSR